MALIQAGFELALDLITDATNGFNKVSVLFDDSSETASQAITWGTPSGSSIGGSVGATVDLVFDVAAGKVVTAIVLYHDTTVVGAYAFPTPFNFTNAGTFTLNSLILSLD